MSDEEETFHIIKKLLHPDLNEQELDNLSCGNVLDKLCAVLKELDKARKLTDAAWRKNTYAG